MNPDRMLAALVSWAKEQPGISAVALVGSHARGDARADSDIDVVILCHEPDRYLRDQAWLFAFGEVERVDGEDWGRVQAVRVLFRQRVEVEFGFTSADWASLPLDPGTAKVLSGGALVLLDREGGLTRALESLNAGA